ncbi:MAG: hypothetical protein ACHQHM_03475, partial [Thermoanaerobaculales bacterium]
MVRWKPLLPLGLCLCLGAWTALPAGLEAAPRPGTGAAAVANMPGAPLAVLQTAEDPAPVEEATPPVGGWIGTRGVTPGIDRCENLPAKQRPLCSLLGDQPAGWRLPQAGVEGDVADQFDIGPLGDDSGGLIGANLPICTYADDVSNTESLDRSSIAYNPNASQYLVVWHAVSRATNYDIFGRFVSASGSVAGTIFAINQDAGLQIAPSVAYDSSA